MYDEGIPIDGSAVVACCVVGGCCVVDGSSRSKEMAEKKKVRKTSKTNIDWIRGLDNETDTPYA